MKQRTPTSILFSLFLLVLWSFTALLPASSFTPVSNNDMGGWKSHQKSAVSHSRQQQQRRRLTTTKRNTILAVISLGSVGGGDVLATSSVVSSSSFLWGLRITSAITSYFGLIGYLDRPQGYLLDNADDYLEVKESQVPGAGLGLYAKVSLPKNTVLGTYPGVVIPLRQNLGKLREYPPCEGYIWRFSDNAFVIDPTNSQGTLEPICVGGNPSMPLSVELHKYLLSGLFQVPTTLCRINEPPKGRDVNVVTDEDKERRQVVFSLERDVFAGEEFFIDYGLSYDHSMYGGGGSSSSG